MTRRPLAPTEIMVAVFTLWLLAMFVCAALVMPDHQPPVAPYEPVGGAGAAILQDAAEVGR